MPYDSGVGVGVAPVAAPEPALAFTPAPAMPGTPALAPRPGRKGVRAVGVAAPTNGSGVVEVKNSGIGVGVGVAELNGSGVVDAPTNDGIGVVVDIVVVGMNCGSCCAVVASSGVVNGRVSGRDIEGRNDGGSPWLWSWPACCALSALTADVTLALLPAAATLGLESC